MAPPPASPDPTNVAVGQRLRRLREERGLTLSALARAAGIGKATLSGLENGTRNPTLETLYAITAQLDVPLAALLTDPGGDQAPAFVPGAAVRGTLLEVFTDPGVTSELYRLEVHPGRTQHSPAHPRGVTEHLTVYAGTLRTGPADAPREVRAGEHFSWVSDVPHVYAAVGDEIVLAALLIRYPRARVS
ncbi:MAG: helix-turn-helix transcriptional regulator [Hamadaea sp.]|nr:helix-turn-helix transcriptional regulator [Hamadaea sp.]